MKPTLAISLIVLGLAAGAFSISPRATANAAEVSRQSMPDNLHAGDKVRICLDRSRSGDVAWVGGTVQSVDADHITVRTTTTDPNPFEGAGNAVSYTREIERWVPMTSVLYTEKLISETTP